MQILQKLSFLDGNRRSFRRAAMSRRVVLELSRKIFEGLGPSSGQPAESENSSTPFCLQFVYLGLHGSDQGQHGEERRCDPTNLNRTNLNRSSLLKNHHSPNPRQLRNLLRVSFH